MKPHSTLLILLVVALILLDLALLRSLRAFPHPMALIFCGLALGQFGLLTAWLVLSRRFFAVRLPVVLAAMGVLGHGLAGCTRPPWAEWLAVLSLYAAGLALVLVPLRLLGLEVITAGSGDSHFPSPSGELPHGRWQFSTLHLFAGTTAVAVFMAGIRLMVFPWPHLVEVLSYCVGFGVVTVSGLSLLAENGCWNPLRLLILFWCALVVGRLAGGSFGGAGGVLRIMVIQAIAVAICMLVIRSGGYRLAFAHRASSGHP